MKKFVSLALLSGSLLAITGCVEPVEYSRHSRHRPGYYDDRRTSTYYESRPVYRDDRRTYRDDGYHRRGDVRVYGPPRPRHSEVRIGF